MKEAMWGVGLIMLAIFGIFLVSLFGNITVTNQQDYTAMRNTVEAAMYDAIDMGKFRSGFCVCTKEEKGADGKWKFTSSSQYEIRELKDGRCAPKVDYQCEKITGEYIIDKNVFAESLVRRFAESVKGNFDYQLVVQDVIEYPPKVSVDVLSSNTYEMDASEEYSISNHIDAILEMEADNLKCLPENVICYTDTRKCIDTTNNYYCGELEETPTPTPKITPTPTTTSSDCIPDTSKPKKEGNKTCYYDKNNPARLCECRTNKTPTTTPVRTRYNPTPIPVRTTPKPSYIFKAFESKKTEVRGGGCFLAGTKVAVKNGYKDIDKMLIGDYILTYNHQEHVNEYKRVYRVFKLPDLDEELYTITTDDTELSLTGHHNVYIMRDNRGGYIEASKMKVGDLIQYSNGKYHEVIKIVHETIKKTVYNLEIEDNHNFFVGDKEILVHNGYGVSFSNFPGGVDLQKGGKLNNWLPDTKGGSAINSNNSLFNKPDQAGLLVPGIHKW